MVYFLSVLQPHPDPALLTTEPPTADNIVDDAKKVNIVAPDFKTQSANTQTTPDSSPNAHATPPTDKHLSRAEAAREAAKRYVHEAELEGFHLWNVTKEFLFRPAVAGGLLGLGSFLVHAVKNSPFVRSMIIQLTLDLSPVLDIRTMLALICAVTLELSHLLQLRHWPSSEQRAI